MKEKVEIKVSEGHNFAEGVYNGMSYTSVSYNGRGYGGGSPCKNDKEVSDSIKNAEETIRNEGDIPILKDMRLKATLKRWFK